MSETPPKPHTIVGNVQIVEAVHCAERGNTRDLLVYLPPSYETSEKRYPVIYMHDGQNLFDEATSFSTEWQVDETMEWLSTIGIEAMIVGIPNMERERSDEYSPFPDVKGGGGWGEAYLRCLVGTMKPAIDARFRTLTDRAHTGIMGSSMGGLISLYAFFRHANVFGFAGCMSSALWFGQKAIFRYVEAAPFSSGRLYLDVGTAEGKGVLEDAHRMHALLRAKGYRRGEQLLYVEDVGAGHTEAAWAHRLRTALYFLLPDA